MHRTGYPVTYFESAPHPPSERRTDAGQLPRGCPASFSFPLTAADDASGERLRKLHRDGAQAAAPPVEDPSDVLLGAQHHHPVVDAEAQVGQFLDEMGLQGVHLGDAAQPHVQDQVVRTGGDGAEPQFGQGAQEAVAASRCSAGTEAK